MAKETEESNSIYPDVNTDKFNVEAAEILANDALRLPISEAVPIYEQLLATFPTSAKFWKQYVEAHMVLNNDEATRQIFSRCLLICLHVPLWRCYINFIRKMNDKKGVEGQEETKKAFEFMLNYVESEIFIMEYIKAIPDIDSLPRNPESYIPEHPSWFLIGADMSSGPVWMEYAAYLKSLPAQTPLEESQRMTSIRKMYQRAIVIPTHHVEQLWRDYENFENSVSRALAKGLLAEYQPKFNSARAVYRERKKYTDEIDWNTLAIPPSASHKEEMQWMAWMKLLSFEKANPQRIDNASANKRIVFAYEQCLMYLYHYPDIWYDYATWHAKTGSRDSAIKVFQRALKALPDSEMLKYAYAEIEESHGAAQAAKKVYESLVGDGVNATALSHIQFLRFVRRTEGVEAAQKHFLDARISPNCTYHVYVAYAVMAFCLDKNPKLAHNIFEAGLKRFMHEPNYILEYVDFLSRLNDDINIRALFERALSSLPPDESVEVWKKFTQFEQTYGDLASMLKVEQRRKEALSRTSEKGESVLESSLQDIASRYSFMELWPCSSKDLDHLARQEWLSRNANKSENPIPMNGSSSAGRSNLNMPNSSNMSGKIVYPDVSRMVIYNPGPGQKPGGPPNTILSSPLTNGVTIDEGTTSLNHILRGLTPSLAAFVASLPVVEGPSPDIDLVISVCLQSNVPLPLATPKSGTLQPVQSRPSPSTSEFSGSTKYRQTREGQLGKRRDSQRQEDDETSSVQSQPLPKDAFKIRQLQKARANSSSRSGAGSASYGSGGFSGDLSGSSI